jgi:hypothetical protein
MIAGIAGSVGHYLAYRGGLLQYPSAMAPNFYGAICGWSASMIVTISLSLLTAPPPRENLAGLVYEGASHPSGGLAWYARPGLQGLAILLCLAILNVIFR